MNESDEDVTKVVQKYFPIGMPFEQVLILLKQLNNDGFEIAEYGHGIGRKWPDGDFNAAQDYLVKLNLEREYPEGTKGFVIQKKYDSTLLVITKTAVISLKVDASGKLSEVDGHVYVTGL